MEVIGGITTFVLAGIGLVTVVFLAFMGLDEL